MQKGPTGMTSMTKNIAVFYKKNTKKVRLRKIYEI